MFNLVHRLICAPQRVHKIVVALYFINADGCANLCIAIVQFERGERGAQTIMRSAIDQQTVERKRQQQNKLIAPRRPTTEPSGQASRRRWLNCINNSSPLR
jgi:hypothetical protein